LIPSLRNLNGIKLKRFSPLAHKRIREMRERERERERERWGGQRQRCRKAVWLH
jgi:hypothetical protein